MFGVIISLTFIILLFAIYYVYKCFLRFNFIKNINNKALRLLVPLIPMILIYILFNFMNATIIMIHLSLFLALSNLIIKLSKKEFKIYVAGIIGIVLTVIYLSYGAYQIYHVYETKYTIETNKSVENLRIIQIADSHVGTTFSGEGLLKHVNKMNEEKPDIVVVTGDFIDDSTTRKDMIDACTSLGKLQTKYGIYFAFGNHDKRYYSGEYTSSDFINELKKNNIIILEDEVIEIGNYYIIGRNDARYKRKSIDELVENLDKSKYMIDLNHQPNDYSQEMNKVDLVLSGHVHGGQMIPLMFFIKPLNIDDEYYGMHKRENTTFIVTSGLSDWAIDFKTGTFSEYVVIDIKGNTNE